MELFLPKIKTIKLNNFMMTAGCSYLVLVSAYIHFILNSFYKILQLQFYSFILFKLKSTIFVAILQSDFPKKRWHAV